METNELQDMLAELHRTATVNGLAAGIKGFKKLIKQLQAGTPEATGMSFESLYAHLDGALKVIHGDKLNGALVAANDTVNADLLKELEENDFELVQEPANDTKH